MLKFKSINYLFIGLFLLLSLLVFRYSWPIYTYLILGAFWFGITIWGATNVRTNYFFEALHQKKTTQKKVALTFDDGPNTQTEAILQLLKKHNVKATFFCIGHKIDENPQLFKKIIEAGHTIGNHTYSHPKNFGFLSAKTVQREIESCDRAAFSHGNIRLNMFRVPFGVSNPKVKKALKNTKHTPIGWSLRSFDALFSSEKYILKRLTKNIKPGKIILLHDSKPHTVRILAELLLFLENNDYTCESVDKLLKINAYK